MVQYVKIAGEEYGLGLLVPSTRPVRCQPFEAKLTYTFEQIKYMLGNSERTPRRELFAGRDWIGNQGRFGSCNGYAAAKALEKARVLRGLKHVKLSGEFIYGLINDDVDRGSGLDEGMAELEKGCASEKHVKVREFYTKRTLPQAAMVERTRFRARCRRIDNEIQFASALIRDWVVVDAVEVGGGYQSLDRDGVRGASLGNGNHATHCVDLRIKNDEFQFDEAGSWDLANGEDGYAWITWKKHLRTTVNKHCFYAIEITSDDPQDSDNPTIL
jgi:hypothetical protein